MNGAIALPLANTVSAPNAAIMIRMGRSQNFFRSLRNAQNSVTNSSMEPSLKLIAHGVRRRPRWPARDPIRSGIRIEAELQEILLHEPEDQSGRHDGAEEEDSEDDRSGH